ncbi:MAG TPA: hypothetical protein VIZ28_06845 [Chitinophagaceae bacterium]
MKFLMIVLAIHFIGEVLSVKREKRNDNKEDEKGCKPLHPAEFDMR